MNNQADQGRSNLGVVVLVVAIGIAFLFAASGSMLGLIRMTPFPEFVHFRPFAFSGMLPLGLMSIIHIILAIWVGIDANRKGQNGVLWALLVLFTSVVGLIVYLLVSPGAGSRPLIPLRSMPPVQGTTTAARPAVGPTCPSCQAEVLADFRICPQCGATLARCSQCDKAIRPDWKACPYCGTAIQG